MKKFKSLIGFLILTTILPSIVVSHSGVGSIFTPTTVIMPALKSTQVSIASCKAVVLINSGKTYYSDYTKYIKPYLDNFGVPYDTIDLKTTAYSSINFNNYSIIIPGHFGVLGDLEYPGFLSQLSPAIKNGVGLYSFDARMFDFQSSLITLNSTVSQPITSLTVVNNSHYITSYHEANESIGLYTSWQVDQNSTLVNSTPLVKAGSAILFESGIYGRGRIVRCNDDGWMSLNVLGPVHGMDDLVWKGIAWAARKPFVMQLMPRFATMRVDDVWGSWGGSNPLSWIGIANNYGFKPWVGTFQNNMSSASISNLKSYIDNRNATASPHAFAGPPISTGQNNIPEEWIFYNHLSKSDYRDTMMQSNAGLAKHFYDYNGLTMSKVWLPHYYEYGLNSIQYVINWGCEFIGTHMQPSTRFRASGPCLVGGPYRLHESTVCFDYTRPVYYADYLRVSNHSEFDGKLFNCITEIRDDNGYEWYPTNDVKATIAHGVTQMKRAFNSMILATLFTHENGNLQYITPVNWDSEMRAIQKAISCYNPTYVTLDYACQYVRAKYNLKLTDVINNGRTVTIKYTGTNDMATKCYKFTNKGSGISETMIDIPQSIGSGQADR